MSMVPQWLMKGPDGRITGPGWPNGPPSIGFQPPQGLIPYLTQFSPSGTPGTPGYSPGGAGQAFHPQGGGQPQPQQQPAQKQTPSQNQSPQQQAPKGQPSTPAPQTSMNYGYGTQNTYGVQPVAPTPGAAPGVPMRGQGPQALQAAPAPVAPTVVNQAPVPYQGQRSVPASEPSMGQSVLAVPPVNPLYQALQQQMAGGSQLASPYVTENLQRRRPIL